MLRLQILLAALNVTLVNVWYINKWWFFYESVIFSHFLILFTWVLEKGGANIFQDSDPWKLIMKSIPAYWHFSGTLLKTNWVFFLEIAVWFFFPLRLNLYFIFLPRKGKIEMRRQCWCCSLKIVMGPKVTNLLTGPRMSSLNPHFLLTPAGKEENIQEC